MVQRTMREASQQANFSLHALEWGDSGFGESSYFSEAARRRSRWGSVRGCPVLSSHFSPRLAPQVGHRTASACFSVTLMAISRVTVVAAAREHGTQYLQLRSFDIPAAD